MGEQNVWLLPSERGNNKTGGKRTPNVRAAYVMPCKGDEKLDGTKREGHVTAKKGQKTKKGTIRQGHVTACEGQETKKGNKRKKYDNSNRHISGKNGAHNQGGWTAAEQKRFHSGFKQFNVPKYGRWSAIASIVKTRTGKQCKNYMQNLQRKELRQKRRKIVPNDPPVQKQGSKEEDEEMELGEEEQQQQQDNAAINWAQCEDCNHWRILDDEWQGAHFRCCDVHFSCVVVDDEAP